MLNQNNPSKESSKSFSLMRDASAHDILDDLGTISKEEIDYYQNLSAD